MRWARLLFLLAIILTGGYLRYSYVRRIDAQKQNQPASPVKLPDGISAKLEDWHYEKTSGSGPQFAIRARNFRMITEPSRYELEKVELKIFHKDGKSFDRVVSDRAVFNMNAAELYSEGEADITMGVTEGEEPSASRLIHIKSSGLRYDNKSGKAETDREATFRLEKGEGKAVGAVYDPTTRELLLKSKAELIWTGKTPNPRPMKVESGQVLYKELESKVFLSPEGKLTRGNMILEGKSPVVTLDKNGIRLVETTQAKGVDRYPGRTIEYTADQLTMTLNEKSEVERIKGVGNAKLVATNDFGVTTTTTNQVDMEFDTSGEESVLKHVFATGNSVVESKPAARPDRAQAETRVLRSETIEMKMRPGGREVDVIDTLSAATLEFLPNRPGQRKRRVEGERFHIAYGVENQIESFHATQSATRTENEPKQGKPTPPSLTHSRELMAYFAPRSGEMTRLEQWGDFRYEEGDRKANSERALLDNRSNRITLVQGARVSDATGTTAADQIILDQKTEDFQAEGNVQSSRAPDRKGSGSAMLSTGEPVQATARKMTTSEKQTQVVYDGNALLWQSANRLQADRIEIDRKESVVRANGKVVNQIRERPKAPAAQNTNAKVAVNTKGAAGLPSMILITAPAMVYSDRDRVAHYTGGAFMRRDDMDVKAREIKAFLKEEKKDDKDEKKEGESSLDKAFADGGVVIVQAARGRTRRGTSEHGEYYVDEAKVILEGGDPLFEDSQSGSTRGQQLIYFTNDDRLLVNGVPSKPGVTKVPRKPHASSSNKRTQ